MTHSRRKTLARPRRPARREGMVLLIVLVIIMMATATASFALNTTTNEIRAAGASRQALRARNVADECSSALQVFLERDGGWRCASQPSGETPEPLLAQYGYSDTIGGDGAYNKAFMLDWSEVLKGNFEASPIASDGELSGGSVSSPYSADAFALVECRKLSIPGQILTTYRLRVTCFGTMGIAGDAVTSGSSRGDHESLSISRFYMDVNETPP